MHPLNIYRLRKMHLPVIASSVIGIGISYVLTVLYPRDGFELDDVIIGAVIGAMIMIIIEIYEIFFAKKITIKMPPMAAILINSMIYLVIIAIIAYVIIYLPDNFFHDGSEEIDVLQYMVILGFCFAAIVLSQFILLLNSFLGKNVLINMMLGRFHNPQNVKRIFMMLDLKNYTSISERIGDRKALSYLNSFYDDVSSAVVVCKGDVYRYVGDEVIITWPLRKKTKNSECIKCFFMIKGIIEKKSAYYMKHYGVVPQFRAGLHMGSVVVGQLGSIKREITYIGDVLNTTSRIEEICKEYNTDIMVSRDLFEVMDFPETYRIKNEYEMNLRGKQQAINLYSIEKK
ncbi:MAG: adenylate/guanylate cyclase domain-containing protein [Spirochaetes bacterium]|nr:adenylate/guanylate cyclase domain-containing protein [Spirochaetota bacterium]